MLLVLRMDESIRKFINRMSSYVCLFLRNDFKLSEHRFIRFLFAGGINTLFGFGIYSLAIFTGSAVWIALLIGTIAGSVFNFFTTGGYVFRELSLGRFPRFVICYALVYSINLGLIEVLVIWLSNEILSQLILIFPIAVFSYFLMAKFVFSNSTKP